MKTQPKTYSVKVGTIPAAIVLRRAYKLRVGLKIEFRDWKRPRAWQRGKIERINPDGYMFISLI
jgi:hypothetical protein